MYANICIYCQILHVQNLVRKYYLTVCSQLHWGEDDDAEEEVPTPTEDIKEHDCLDEF